MRKIVLLSTLYFLLSTLLIGCATTPSVSLRIQETVRIGGTSYVSVESLSEVYNAQYLWDPIVKKATLAKDDNEVKMLADSSTVLVNNQVQSMRKEARLYRGALFIPQSFARKTLQPLFAEAYIETRRVPDGLGVIRNVIIDPGHGGKDPGAIGRSGLMEKDVVLDIAKRLNRKLSSCGIDVTMTRESDNFVSLGERARIANRKNADFFISIHANAARSRWVSGVEVFYLCESIDDDSRSLKAAKNYDLQLKESYSGKNTAAILWDLIYKENRRSSIDLAEVVCYSLSKKLGQRNRGKKPARFYVLKGTNIAAVLIEVGFLSNSREEEKLGSSSYRDTVAQAIAEGITRYNHTLAQRP